MSRNGLRAAMRRGPRLNLQLCGDVQAFYRGFYRGWFNQTQPCFQMTLRSDPSRRQMLKARWAHAGRRLESLA